MDIKQADFLTTAEFFRGPDLLRPGTLTGKNVDPGAVAFVYCAFLYSGEEPDIRVSETDTHLIFWPAPMGHEKVADREPVLRALFGPDFREAAKVAAYEQPIYEMDEQGNLKSELIVVGTKLAYDAIELRRLAVRQNLFGRFGKVRAVPCLMLWNQCENWQEKLDKLLVLFDVADDGLITQGNTEQLWATDWKAARP
jgi:hypothetical protein